MFKYLRLVTQCGWKILWDFLFYIDRYARHPEKYPLEKRYAKVRSIIRFVLDHYRIDWKVEGLDYLRELEKNDQLYVVVGNHLSDFDPLGYIYWSEKPISFVCKKEIAKFPFIGNAVRACDGVFMDREDLRQELKVMIEVRNRLRAHKCSYMIFPEGTRNKKPETPMAPFKPGSFKLVTTTGIPLLPFSEFGTFRVFPKKPDYKRLPIEMTFYKPITKEEFADGDTVKLSNRVENFLRPEVERLRAEDKEFFDKGYQNIPMRKGPVR
jgi:1-acyl-sn-glycerol-3-phosphate acyltransferase